jgi:two-component system OmpR family response regulator/two-component system alkaline phosphatase synthesis response regulator PhoP
MTANPRILVVEDEPNIRELVCLHLGLEGYVCHGVGDGREALTCAEAQRFDLLVIDVMIPGLDGLALCRAVRNGRTNHDVPILILTARREESDKVVGLESGADDYLTKPFGVRELVARSRALLRRPRQPVVAAAEDLEPAEGQPIVRVHDVEIDPARRRVRVDGKDVELTDQEFRLLHFLATRAGIVFSREALLAKIWRGDVRHRAERRYAGQATAPPHRAIQSAAALLTVWGVG